MGEFSKIEWTHYTHNPVEGCQKVSPGCENCYAEERNNRFSAGKNWGPNTPRLGRSDSYLRQPFKWNREAREAGERRRVFCASLADVMEDHPDWIEPRQRLFGTIRETPWLDWLMLTKRPENFDRFLPWGRRDEPWPNVWLGVTTEDNKRLQERGRILLQTPAVVRFFSAEPLLEDLDIPRDWLSPFHDRDPMLRETPKIDWVIVGGESGHKSRTMALRWARRISAVCRETETPIFMKQLGAKPCDESGLVHLRHKKGGDPDEWPEDLRTREFPIARAA